MFRQKKFIVVAIVVVLAVMITVPALGAAVSKKSAKFRREISDRQFLEMCKEGDIHGVIEAIKAGMNADTQDDKGMTALMFAAREGHTQTVNALIRAGADDLIDNEGGTALIFAARSEESNAETVNLLIDAGSYVKQKDTFGNTALYYARNNPALKGTNALKRLEELSK